MLVLQVLYDICKTWNIEREMGTTDLKKCRVLQTREMEYGWIQRAGGALIDTDSQH